ncbi:sporulation protein YabP [Anaerotignum lactatifermentans]|uniref:Sporulation protein YabP n=1 Tax=Anaerotignum lactatifermentans TaxID=160404 RepID=A0ABS2GA45_9FIRM|nr:sporulation protein YabP [Anaerotignum lactatifermentans]MBM6829859.1 sporulation protein YabP [Anaerotignum lactatifermentans]MBM6878361.1 sporulation protein YabP [Anaerotignum lactatifermentans]MBM6951516.1 sporulation protein YabP [Anaerotignum lactatifermentans]
MGEEKRGLRHSVVVEERERLRVGGVLDVPHFDEESIVLETECGRLTIHGEGLRIGKLNLEEGEFAAEGQIDAVTYAEGGAEGRGSFLSRLLR